MFMSFYHGIIRRERLEGLDRASKEAAILGEKNQRLYKGLPAITLH
jgi:hypothetical protein